MSSPLLRAAETDPDAFAECIDRYGGLVWSVARRYLGNDPDAEDAVQEIFIELWRAAARFDPARASDTTFVVMIARRRLIDRFRKKAARPRLELIEPEADAPSAAARVAANDAGFGAEAAGVQRILGQLAEEQRTVLALSIFEGFSHGEIAARLGMPLGTVKSHARRGMIKARELLARDLGDAARSAPDTAPAGGPGR